MVSATLGGSITTFWNLLSNAPSFSMCIRYSSKVEAPIHCNSPLANAGLNILEASNEPLAPPAPTIVCISSMNKMTSLFFSSSFIIAFILSSNCPLYFVPATKAAKSSEITRLSNKTRLTFLWTIRKANPSTMAVLPTPGSPIKIGLFFLRRLKIWLTLSISASLPTIGSKESISASLVISRPKLSSTGVLDLLAVAVFAFGLAPKPEPPLFSSSNSSSASSGNSALGGLIGLVGVEPTIPNSVRNKS